MQPQGHVQVLLNKLRGFSAQACLDAPRFCISAGLPVAGQNNDAGDLDSQIFIEEGVDPKVIEELRGESLQLRRCSLTGRDGT
jgi:gamma-glutamyltranspeptidase/glutathione hydrolase